MSVTAMLVAPLITWLFVSTSQDESTTIPVPPHPVPGSPRRELMSTKPGSILAASADRSMDLLDAPGELADGAAADGAKAGVGRCTEFLSTLASSFPPLGVAESGAGSGWGRGRAAAGVSGTAAGGSMVVGGATVAAFAAGAKVAAGM